MKWKVRAAATPTAVQRGERGEYAVAAVDMQPDRALGAHPAGQVVEFVHGVILNRKRKMK